MNERMQCDKPQRIVFLISKENMDSCREELEEACRYFERCKVRGTIEQISGKDMDVPDQAEGVLYITDQEDVCRRLVKEGYAAAGYLHEKNRDSTFQGIRWILSEPAYIDIDSYDKIYQRIKDIPWTILETPRCIVREMALSDLDAIYELYDDPEAAAFLDGPDPDRGIERARLEEYIQKIYGFYGYGYWSVVEKASGEMIGRVGFAVQKAGMAYVPFGYIIRKDRRRMGFAGEVTQAVLEYALENLDLPGIGAQVRPGNTASVRVLEKLGFEPAGGTEEELCFILPERR
ncbi:MAG: GNAT family N-acetyltransferase [Lachnospiraceae bacterium]|nr:GNAT family N-acetyltransferase [Lachnospiraceae bacterium]